jgi:hypothetical protein
MAGWNGSGQFDLLYDWTQDAANNLPISSSRMQAQDQLLADGLENCITRDGQTAATANISLGGFKVLNLGTPTLNTDASTKAYVDAAVDQWRSPGSISYTWLSSTSFRFDGADYTALLTVGRRLKITHNGGATTSYATILSSSYGAPNTTVTVLVDGGTALVSAVTNALYGLLSPNNPSAPVWGEGSVYKDPPETLTNASYKLLCNGAVAFWDTLSEWSTDRWIPKVAGTYLFSFSCQIVQNSATITNYFGIAFQKNGATVGNERYTYWPYTVGTANVLLVNVGFYGTGTAGISANGTTDYFQVKMYSTFTGGPPSVGESLFNMKRIT